MFLQVCVILFTGGVPDQVHPLGPGTTPWTRYTPLGPGTPPDQVHPLDQVHPPGPGTHPPDQVHPPGPGTPPRTRYTPQTRYTPLDQVHPPPDQVHPPGPGTPCAQHAGRYGLCAGSRHPTGMQSCRVRSCTFIWCYPMKM